MTAEDTASDNDAMIYTCRVMAFLLAVGALPLTASAAGDGLGTVYWCPSRAPDRQYSATPAPDCSPMVVKQERPEGQDSATKQREAIKLESIQGEVSRFLREYNQFIECCATRTDLDDQLSELEEQAAHLLNAMQETGFVQRYMYQRGMTVVQLATPVVQASNNLKKIRTQHDQIRAADERRNREDYELTGRDTQAIQNIENAITKDNRGRKVPGGAKTGTEIGVTPAAGSEIGKVPAEGSGIGGGGTTGTDIGKAAKTGAEIGSTGSVGFEIGGTGRAGPEIGESGFNSGSSRVGSSLQQSTVGSSLNDSTVGSSLGPSTTGSSQKDSTLGSTLGGSTTGSSLQNRGTAPQ